MSTRVLRDFAKALPEEHRMPVLRAIQKYRPISDDWVDSRNRGCFILVACRAVSQNKNLFIDSEAEAAAILNMDVDQVTEVVNCWDDLPGDARRQYLRRTLPRQIRWFESQAAAKQWESYAPPVVPIKKDLPAEETAKHKVLATVALLAICILAL